MRIAIHDSEKEHLKRKTFPNLALMRITAYHRQKEDLVEWLNPNQNYDMVYSSKIFNFTPTNAFLPSNAIKGGTGYNIQSTLPPEIEAMTPDYSIYPEYGQAIGFITRGCINNCSFCVVPQKEGEIRAYARWQDIVRRQSNNIVLMDNNILASNYGISQLEELSQTNYAIDLNQGMDITLINDEICAILKRIKWIKYLRFSCDKDSQLPYFENFMRLLKQNKMSISNIFIYVLVDDIAKAERRIRALHDINKSFSIYAQPFRDINQVNIVPKKAKEFCQRYVYGRLYKKESFAEYCVKRGLFFNN